MNLNQGMRRLAILAGVVGAVAGGVYAYKQLHSIPSQRYQHRVFEELAASDVVKHKQARLASFQAGDPDFDWPHTSDVSSDLIKTIFWHQDHSVDFFVMQDGGYVTSEPSPSAWSYLLWVVFPAFGFLIPWGAIRGIGWVGAGFFQP